MNWFKMIGQAIVTAVTLGDRLYVRIVPCTCGKPGAKVRRVKRREYYVYCPFGCRRRSAVARTRRRAKINWREELKEG
jgi:hypothetical protein